MRAHVCRRNADGDAVQGTGATSQFGRDGPTELRLRGRQSVQPVRQPGLVAQGSASRGDAGEHDGQRAGTVRVDSTLRRRVPLSAAQLHAPTDHRRYDTAEFQPTDIAPVGHSSYIAFYRTLQWSG